MKRSLLILALCLCFFNAMADHITGGEMYYTYNGLVGGDHSYTVTLKLFMRCNSGRQFPDPAVISVFNKDLNTRFRDYSVSMSHRETIQLNPDDNPCITDPPQVCYEVAYYTVSVTVPPSTGGYVLASEVNYRIRGINNIAANQVGATYTCEIPGTNSGTTALENNSAVFTGSDLVIVCSSNYFAYSFGASDPDGDNIRYSFCNAYASTTNGVNGVPAGFPPYPSLPYAAPNFFSNRPLGADVSIDQSTGLITGVAPAAGIYVVTVCAEEIRDNKVIAIQRKDIQINITDCSIAAARLEKDYMLCRTSRDIIVTNLSNSPLIVTYDWSVINAGGTTLFTTTDKDLAYTFAADGVYKVQLIVNRGQQCSDSAEAPVYVFPGTITNFNSTGICITKPTFFFDQSSSPSGTVNSWAWDFGEPSGFEDVSTFENPEYTYPVTGIKTVKLTVTLTNGCRDTVSRNITIIDKPPITFAFRDTLICLNDQLQLIASGAGNFTWSPAVNIINANSATPTVSPPVTTTYYAELNSDGCLNTDSVQVRVVDHVSLQLMPDTTICTLDTISLRIVSDGLRYTWTPANQLIDPLVANPIAITPATTNYLVNAVIGGCNTTGSILIRTVDYPIVNAGRDSTICYNSVAQLQATSNGTSWQWTPASSIRNGNTLTPLAYPRLTTNYVLTVYNLTSGCPKPVSDTVVITVLPEIHAFAGRDTAVIIGQPLQMNGSGGERYVWAPPTGLSSASEPTPVAIYFEPSTGIRYTLLVYNSAGCVDSAFMTVKVFATMPTVFVPSAFTPNNDGLNDLLRPIAVGMSKIEYFSIYNRWGQLVFTTKTNGHGWDGKINGQTQTNNTFVWMVKAVDFNGRPYFSKGTVTLIR